MFLWETHIMFLMLVCESLYGGEAFKNIHKRATSTPPILNANIWDVYMLTFFPPAAFPGDPCGILVY